MKDIISSLNGFLKNAGFEWCVCGGHAIDLFTGHTTRHHRDVDISVYWQDKRKVISFMLDAKWRVFEALGNGIVCEATDASNSSPDKRNLFCMDRGNLNCKLSSMGNDMYQFALDSSDQHRLDYIEFLFNHRTDDSFLYAHNHSVRRALGDAVQCREGTPYLAPEIVLLYKSSYIDYLNKEDEHALRLVSGAVNDFNTLLPLLGQESKAWLGSALKTVYPSGHAWLRRLEKASH